MKIRLTSAIMAGMLAFCLPLMADDDDQKKSLTTNLPEKASIIVPDTTCMYVQRGEEKLYMDIYHAAEGSETVRNGKEKPTILYIFGGGFVTGEKDAILQLRYYKRLTEEGFNVIAIDYRLGLKDMLTEKVSMMKMAGRLPHAMQIAVEDLYAATAYLLENGEALDIDPDNLIVSGSSAGAVVVLQADYQMCNRSKFEVSLPQGYRYKGIISFSGGVYSTENRPDYREATPSPTLLLHGTEDRIVNYKKLKFFNRGFYGASTLVKRLEKYGCNYNILRYKGNGHEVAGSLRNTLTQQLNFIYENVMEGQQKIMDVTLRDPNIDTRFSMRRFKDLGSFKMMNPGSYN